MDPSILLGSFFRGLTMVRMKEIGLTDYEKKDLLWWCKHHKNTIGFLALRLEQVLDGQTDLEGSCRILIKNVKEENGFTWEYYENERTSNSGSNNEKNDSGAC
jgi:hypothetical protein